MVLFKPMSLTLSALMKVNNFTSDYVYQWSDTAVLCLLLNRVQLVIQ